MGSLKDNLEVVIAIVGAASAISGALFAVLIYMWKASRWAGKFLDRDKLMADQLRKASLRLGQVADQMQKVRMDIAGLTIRLDEREKDQARLEGKIEQNTAAMMKLTGDLRELANSTGRLWTTLRAARPDLVPKRAGEPG